jgi:hypothetical protein
LLRGGVAADECGKYSGMSAEARYKAETICKNIMPEIGAYAISSEKAAEDKRIIQRICGCVMKGGK